jgi:molecular chaperone DnaK
MAMRIGVDFGTTYTKIAYVDKKDNLQLFTYPAPPNGRRHVPTVVAYRDGESEPSVGRAARSDAINRPGVTFYEAFKMLLPLKKDEDWRAHGWPGGRTPAEVTRVFLSQLLRDAICSLEQVHGNINSLVVSIPELWQQTEINPGAEVLRTIVADELGLPLDHLRSEPVCAAAYYVYRYQQLERRSDRPFNLLVCDTGGGTFDVALCHVSGSEIKVLDFDGAGQHGLGQAGVAFDREAVQLAYRNAHGGAHLEPGDPDFVELLKAFEEVKIEKHEEAVAAFRRGRSPELEDTPLYQFRRKYLVTCAQARAAFEPIGAAIGRVLRGFRERARERDWTIDRVAVVGGFGQFPLVQEAILKALGIRDDTDVRFDRKLNSQNRFYAVALGAALIANGLIEPVEQYPHTLGISVHRTHAGRLQAAILPIVRGGEVVAGHSKPHFAANARGERVVVSVESRKFGALPVRLQLHGSGKDVSLSVPQAEYPPPGRYYVGAHVDRSNLGRLIFQPVGGGESIVYRLGDVAPSLLVEDA